MRIQQYSNTSIIGPWLCVCVCVCYLSTLHSSCLYSCMNELYSGTFFLFLSRCLAQSLFLCVNALVHTSTTLHPSANSQTSHSLNWLWITLIEWASVKRLTQITELSLQLTTDKRWVWLVLDHSVFSAEMVCSGFR